MAALDDTTEHPQSRLRVAFLGEDTPDASVDGWELVPAGSDADVYHVHHDRLEAIPHLRARSARAAVVVDLRTIEIDGLDRHTVSLACLADDVVVSSQAVATAIAQRDRRFVGRLSVLGASIDLARFAPDAELAATRRVQFSRFKRYHRLAPPTVMFAGPYVPGLGLDVVLDVMFEIREEVEEIRFSAIPCGRVDRRYLDRCERRALLLGHRGIVQWEHPADDELPFWLATASVVIVAGSEAESLSLLAAAAARPVVPWDPAAAPGPAALAAAIRDMLGPAGVAAGEAARREIVASQAALARRLAQVWSSAAVRSGVVTTALARASNEDATSVLPSSSTVIQAR